MAMQCIGDAAAHAPHSSLIPTILTTILYLPSPPLPFPSPSLNQFGSRTHGQPHAARSHEERHLHGGLRHISAFARSLKRTGLPSTLWRLGREGGLGVVDLIGRVCRGDSLRTSDHRPARRRGLKRVVE